jgi:hypothetical protein
MAIRQSRAAKRIAQISALAPAFSTALIFARRAIIKHMHKKIQKNLLFLQHIFYLRTDFYLFPGIIFYLP